MTKLGKYERLIYLIIYFLFLIVGFFPICLPFSNFKNGSNELVSYYYALFGYFQLNMSIQDILMLTLLFIPLICSIISISCLLTEFKQNNANNAASYTWGIATFFFAVTGFLYATLTNSTLVFGMIILSISIGIGINKIIFYYGLKGLRI